MPARSPRPAALTVLLGGLIAAGCSLTSLDRYFECEPEHPNCKNAAAPAGGDAGFAAMDAGGNVALAGAGNAGGREVAGTSAIGGTGDGATGGGGASGRDGSGGGASGNAGSPASAGATGAGRGESCVASTDCAMLTCFRNICGDPLELSYLDTPDVGSVPTAAKWIKFEVLITNRTTVSYELSRLKVRYYYTEDGATSEFQLLSTMSPPTAPTDVIGTFGVSEGWTYLEISFDAGAGTLGPGKQSGAVKVGVHDLGFGTATFIEPGDYSYAPDVGMSHAPTANRHVTLYLDSLLVSGDEPKSPPPQ
jgi:hypothetical protein